MVEPAIGKWYFPTKGYDPGYHVTPDGTRKSQKMTHHPPVNPTCMWRTLEKLRNFYVHKGWIVASTILWYLIKINAKMIKIKTFLRAHIIEILENLSKFTPVYRRVQISTETFKRPKQSLVNSWLGEDAADIETILTTILTAKNDVHCPTFKG